MPLATSLKGIVFAKRVGDKGIGHQDTAKVGMPFELDSEHIPDFAFEPIGAFPESNDTAYSWVGFIQENAHGELFVGPCVRKHVDQSKAMLGIAIMHIVDTCDIDKEVESCLFVEGGKDIEGALWRSDPADLSAKFAGGAR